MKRLFLFSGLVILLVLTLSTGLYAQMGFNTPTGVRPTQDMEVYSRNSFLVEAKYRLTTVNPNSTTYSMSCKSIYDPTANYGNSVSALAGTVRYPAEPGNYVDGQDCRIRVNSFENQNEPFLARIMGYQISFQDLQLAPGDSLFIHSRANYAGAYFFTYKFGGATLPKTFNLTPYPQNFEISIITNDDGFVGRGFVLQWRAIYNDTSDEPFTNRAGYSMQYNLHSGAFRVGDYHEYYSSAPESIALGSHNNLYGRKSVAIGDRNSMYGGSAKAFGNGNIINSGGSMALGYNNYITGETSIALGGGNIISADNSIAFGFYNASSGYSRILSVSDTNRLFQIGNGRENSRSNAFTMLRNARTILNGVNNINLPNGSDAMLRINHNSSVGDGHVVLYEQDNDFARLDFKNNQTTTFWTIAGKPGGLAQLNFYYYPVGDILQLKGDGSATLAGTLTQNSDRRLKRNVQPLTAWQSLDKLTQLNGYHYHWRDANRSQTLQTGLIAQEVQQFFPELVETDAKGYLSVNYIGLMPHLIESVKVLAGKNDRLEKTSQTLNTENSQLKADMADLRTRLETLERHVIRTQN